MRFLYPEFLLALIFLAIPIIIHLFNFRRYKKIPFTNVRFLRELKEESSGQSRLKKLLILASRLLAVLFLVLAFAGPFIPLSPNIDPASANEISVYLDNSFSMETQTTEGNLLEDAKKKAREIANAFSANDRFQLITNDFDGKSQRLVSRDEYLNLIDEVKVSPASRKIQEISDRQFAVFGKDKSVAKSSFIISDFQKSMFNSAVLKLDSSIKTNWILIAKKEEASNLNIDSAYFISPLHQQNSSEQLVVSVRNYGKEAVQNLPIKLILNGQQKSIGNITIGENSFALDTVSFQTSNAGIQNVSISITDFPITFDDTYHLSYSTQDRKSISILSESEPNKYLNSVYQSEPFFQVTNFTSGTIDYKKLSESNLVILDGLQSISSGLKLELEKFVSSGGSLFVFPSEKADLISYQSALSNVGSDYLTSINSIPNEVNFINLESQLFKSVFEKIPKNLDLPKVKNHFLFSKSANRNAENILSMKAGESFLNQYQYKKGKVYLCAVPMNAENSNLPSHSVFVPMMYRAALLSFQEYPLAYKIGSDNLLETAPISLSKNQNLKLIGENFELVPELRNTDALSFLYIADQIKNAGFYNLKLDKSVLNTFAFNFNRAESELKFYQETELKTMNSSSNFSVIKAGARPLDDVMKTNGAGFSLWKWALLLVLLFLAIEILLLRFLK